MRYEYKTYDQKDGVNPDDEHELDYLSRKLSWELVAIRKGDSPYGGYKFYFKRPVMCKQYLKSLGIGEHGYNHVIDILKLLKDCDVDTHEIVNSVLINPYEFLKVKYQEEGFIVNDTHLKVSGEVHNLMSRFAACCLEDFP
jgi:hypothetical protein